MNDTLGRKITYLRLSVTDLCDLRCIYCLPEHGVPKRAHSEICSLEELCDIAVYTRQGAIPFHDFMPDGINKGIEVLDLHGSLSLIHI